LRDDSIIRLWIFQSDNIATTNHQTWKWGKPTSFGCYMWPTAFVTSFFWYTLAWIHPSQKSSLHKVELMDPSLMDGSIVRTLDTLQFFLICRANKMKRKNWGAVWLTKTSICMFKDLQQDDVWYWPYQNCLVHGCLLLAFHIISTESRSSLHVLYFHRFPIENYWGSTESIMRKNAQLPHFTN
jgi:hypothetical protein